MNTLALPRRPAAMGGLLAACLVACYLVWGSTYLAIRVALESFPPFFQMGTRFLAAGALLMLYVAWRRRGGARAAPAWPDARQWRNAAVVGGLMLTGGMGLTASAEQDIGSGLIAAFIAIVPITMAACGLFIGQRPTRTEVLGMVVGLGGVVLLVQGTSFAAAPAGLLAITGAVVTWCIGSVLSTSRFPLAPGAAGYASEMLCGGAMLMVVSLAMDEVWAVPSARALAAWAYLVVFGSLVAFSAYMVLLAQASPAVASSYAFVNPVIALALGTALGGEHVAAGEWLACGVILAGVVLLFRGKTASLSPTKSNSSQ